MHDERATQITLPVDVLARADAVAERTPLHGGLSSPAQVLRLAVERGIAVLELEAENRIVANRLGFQMDNSLSPLVMNLRFILESAEPTLDPAIREAVSESLDAAERVVMLVRELRTWGRTE